MTAEALDAIARGELQRVAGFRDRILCCSVAGCLAAGGDAVRKALAAGGAEVDVCGTGCMGLCSEGPLVRSAARDTIYTNVAPADAPAILSGDYASAIRPDDPFFKGQHRLILANSGHTDPERIEDYIAAGGYRA